MVPLAELSLYIHIPFCRSRCRYCDFYSVPGATSERMDATAAMLERELSRVVDRWKPRSIPTVFIGGGTPSVLGPRRLEPFLNSLRRIVGEPAETTMEVNPESLSEELVELLNSSIVNRISMGVQTYDEGLLEWLGRPAGASAVCHADDLLDRYWNGSLNRDLLAGLPGNAGRLEDDVKQALKSDPGHLSVYELTIEPGTALAGNPAALEELPEEQERHMEWKRLRRVLADRGYRRYEVSNFARPGRECRHNLAYWTMKPYLGIGPGAVSTLPGPNGKVVRYEEPANLALWLDAAGQSAHQTELSRYEFALEHFMMALRTAGGLSRDRFGAVFGIDPADVVPGSLDKWIRSGSLELTSEAIRPTDDGLDLVDAILADMAEELEVRLPSGGLRWPLS